MTVWPARRMRSRMLPPILPRPMRPSCIAVMSEHFLQFTVGGHEGGGGGVEAGDVGALGPGGFDALGEDLAELDAPLVEGVDVPDRALDERLVLVEGDQLTQDRGGERLGQDGGRGVVALEGAVRHLLLGNALRADL